MVLLLAACGGDNGSGSSTSGGASTASTTSSTAASNGNAGTAVNSTTPPAATGATSTPASPTDNIGSGAGTGTGAGGNSAAPLFAYDTTARFNGPTSVAADGAGNLYVLDFGNNAIRRIAASGELSTVLTGLVAPHGLEVDATGNLYTNDNGSLRKIAPDGGVTVLASVPATAEWMTIDSSGNLYLLDKDSAARTGAILQVTATGAVSTVASSATTPELNDQNRGIAIDAAGNFYIGTNVSSILRIPASGQASVHARGFTVIIDLAILADGNLYVTDFAMSSHIGSSTPGPTHAFLRRVAQDGTVTTVTSSAPGPGGFAIGTDGNIYTAYRQDHSVQKVTPAGVVTIVAGKSGESGSAD
jgi:sugar lactone lactonase YvrE